MEKHDFKMMQEDPARDPSSSLSTGSMRTASNLSSHDRFARSDSMVQAFRQDSIGRRSSRGSSRRGSISFSRDVGDRILDSINLSRNMSERILGVIDDSSIAQVGDHGNRVVADEEEGNGNLGFSVDVENGIMSLSEDASNSFRSRNVNSSSLVTSLEHSATSPLPTDAILHLSGRNQDQITSSSFKDANEKLPPTLDCISYMIHLALFGELGVFTRYLLQKFFGPNLLALTGDQTPIYLDLPANMLGSFLMGWFGIVFKADIRNALSDHIVVGLSTGYLGSLTTFSGWNQKMLSLASKGHWVFAVAGIILGMILVDGSIRIGVESGEALRLRILKWLNHDMGRTKRSVKSLRINSPKRHMTVMSVMLFVLLALLGLSGALARRKLDRDTSGAILWLGCLVGPPGVWGRWYLARLNGQGLGRKGSARWLPVGTLSANVLAASIMAALATISNAVNTKRCGIIVSGVQFGFLGCLSTVSTFVAEVYAMRQSGHSGRALAYVVATFVPSFAIGTLIYSIPVWTMNYE